MIHTGHRRMRLSYSRPLHHERKIIIKRPSNYTTYVETRERVNEETFGMSHLLYQLFINFG